MGYNFGALRVLIVDDNANMRLLLRTLLRSMGFRTMAEAADGGEGFAVFCAFKPDLVIADWVMEPVGGRDLIRRIRVDPDSINPYVPVIMMSGHAERDLVIEARDVGVTEFLAKPVSARTLYGRLMAMVDRPRPFVRSAQYFGPDRRRREDSRYTGPDRRQNRQPAAGLGDQGALGEVRDRLRAMLDTYDADGS